MNPISKHYYTGHAYRHPTIGCISALASTLAALLLTNNTVVAAITFLCAGFCYGVLIEIGQRIVRDKAHQNTLRESIFDALVTGCWPLFLWHDVVKR